MRPWLQANEIFMEIFNRDAKTAVILIKILENKKKEIPKREAKGF